MRATFGQTLFSFKSAFWYSNLIELCERWAYYGVRAGIAVYMVTAVAFGGLAFDHLQKANIFFWWAAFQSLLPTFIGGFADRYGYKRTVSVAVILSVLGYINMSLHTDYWPFFIACMMVATGTAIFKPGIQGIIAHSTNSQNASLGWSFFYMMVNVGGFTGPLIAGYLRLMSWRYVFITSAIMHSLNLLIVLFVKEPESEVARRREQSGSVTGISESNAGNAGNAGNASNAIFGIINSIVIRVKEFFSVFWLAVKNLADPGLAIFLLIFSGFWLMFMQLFDLLPNFITDWVDTASVSIFFGKIFSNTEWIAYGVAGKQLPAEWLINLDAGAVILLMLLIGWFCSRMHPVAAIVVGMLVATVGLLVSGYTMSPWICCAGIFIFAIGEMIASPRKSEYLAMIAPPGKKGLYMGYVNFPQGIGWMIGSKIAGPIYQYNGDKLTLAKKYLSTHLGMSEEAIKGIPPERVLDVLTQKLGHANSMETTTFLFNFYHPENIWWIFCAIGMASMLCMVAYYLLVVKKRRLVDDAEVSISGGSCPVERKINGVTA
ncbi:MAG: MFS transporter [Oligoflexia bacterium]|nr:MFS transporter [Oligoflexia bacterium]